MRLSGVVLILILSTSISCKKDKLPEGVLTKQQMADWMLDIYLAEARTQVFTFTRDSIYKLFLPYQDSIMKVKGIDSVTLRTSFQYYFDRPIEMDQVYDVVIDSLSVREQRLLPGPAQNTPLQVIKPVPGAQAQ